MNTIRQFFRELDMFPTPANLRIREEPEIRNGCVGFISLLVLLFFVFVFFNSFIKTVGKESIQYSVGDEILPDEEIEFQTDAIMYAISVLDLNYSTAAGIFAVKMLPYDQNVQSIYYMEQCTPSHWQMLGQNYEEEFNELHLENYFCPPKDLKFKHKHSVKIDFCQDNQTPDCLSHYQAYDAYYELYDHQDFIQMNLAMVDTGFTLSQQNPTIKIVDTHVFLSFTDIRSTYMYIDYSRYRVETDESIMPWEETKIEEGVYISNVHRQSFENNGGFRLVYMDVQMRLQQKTIQRVVGKFDDMLSYAGGLFAIIIGFLSFFLISFNEYRYELLVGQRAFSYDEKGNKVRESDFNFLFYVQYSLFDWLNVLFCLDLQWGRCKRVDQTREELNKQIDTTLLMRRLQHIERCVFSTVGEDYKMGMYMHRSEHLEEIKLNRMYLEYYEWIIKGAESLTVEDIETAEHIFSSPNQLNANSLMDFAMKSSSRGLLSTVMDKFPELQEEALSIQLTEEQLEVEKDLASAFRSMNSKVKEKLEKKIPLKILYRFKTYDKPKMPPLIHSGMDLDESPQ